jgi:hypothetical protein
MTQQGGFAGAEEAAKNGDRDWCGQAKISHELKKL